jgi:hypothetical protein
MKKIQTLISFLLLGMVIFVVSCKPSGPKGTLAITKTQFAPGEEIKLKFTAEGEFGPNAWIGVIPSSAPHGDESKNDEFDIDYQYFTGTAGELTFTAPGTPGDFDFRMNTTDQTGIEVASVSFKIVVTKTNASLKTDKTEYAPGESIVINFTAPAEITERGWIGLIPSATVHGSEETNDGADVAYEYLSKRTAGSITMTAPEQKGSWDIRMNDTDNNGNEVASVTITVK